MRYPHNALRFTNHVGEQRNFCKQKCDVPLLVCLSNSTLSAQRSAYFFKTLYGTTFPHTARLHKFMNNQTLPLRAGCRGRQPLHLVQTNSLCRKIATLFADFTLCYGMEKAVQSFVLRHRFDFAFSLFFFYCCTHNGFHPLTLTRGVPLVLLLASLGVNFYFMLVICSVGYAIPHSSL